MPSSVSTLPVDGITRGDHVCAVLEGQAMQEEIVTEFVGAGLQRHERVAYFARDGSRERVLGILQAGGIPTAEAVAEGQLLVVPAENASLDGPPFDPSARIAGLNAAIDAARVDGYSGFRATGEQWSTELPPEELLVEYEIKVGELCAARSAVGLCQYETPRCEPHLIDEVLRLHDRLVQNPVVSTDGLLRVVPLSQDEHGDTWLRVAGEADLSNSALLVRVVDDTGVGNIHLDLVRLRFVDLKGVEALEELALTLRHSRRRLILHNPPATLRRIAAIVSGSLCGAEISAP